MLEKIEYIFPKNEKNMELFNFLSILFKDIKYVTNINERELHVIPLFNLKPKTVFILDDNISNMRLNIGNEKYENLLNMHLENITSTSKIIKLPIEYVSNKLLGHIKRIDHTGINLPTKIFNQKEWDDILQYFSSVSNVYNYPTGEPWPFLIPVTEDENKNDITNFEILRDPRFELVYDKYTNVVTIHIDIETDLSELEIENFFPKNQGVYFDGCDFKAIYLDYIKYIDIRLDIRPKGIHGDWENGKWLVCEGKRI